jgi:hypothetical protein
MSALVTTPNLLPAVRTLEIHRLPLLGLCPHSGNPQPGSTITICYRPHTVVLEVYALQRYLHSFIGGKIVDGVQIRDMEQTIQRIAVDAAGVLEVPVRVRADLVLQQGQELFLCCRVTPR